MTEEWTGRADSPRVAQSHYDTVERAGVTYALVPAARIKTIRQGIALSMIDGQEGERVMREATCSSLGQEIARKLFEHSKVAQRTRPGSFQTQIQISVIEFDIIVPEGPPT